MSIGRRQSTHTSYYGWIITWTFALTETISWGILYYAYSALLVPMQEEFGWSSAAINGAYSLAMLVSGLVAPFVGRWLDNHGPRSIMTTGSIAGTLLILAWSRVETLTGFYLLWVGIGLASAVTLYEPAFATLTQWFRRDRSRAMLIVTVAAGFASTIFLPLTGWLVEATGWRTTLVILAIILGLLTIPPHALFLRRRPADLGLTVDGYRPLADDISPSRNVTPPSDSNLSEALHSPGFWWMTLAFFLQTFASTAIAVHLIAYLTERGDGATFAATVTGLIGAAQVAARIVITVLDRRFSLISLTAFIFALQALAIGILVLWTDPAGVIFSVIFLGMGRGAVTLIRPGLIADLYGSANFGAISGWQSFVLTWARALAPVAMGVGYAVFGGYTPMLWILAAISGASALAMLPGDRETDR